MCFGLGFLQQVKKLFFDFRFMFIVFLVINIIFKDRLVILHFRRHFTEKSNGVARYILSINPTLFAPHCTNLKNKTIN